MRAELRSVLMFRIAPPVVAMWHQAVTKPAVIPPDDQMVPVNDAAIADSERALCPRRPSSSFSIRPTGNPEALQCCGPASNQAFECCGRFRTIPFPGLLSGRFSFELKRFRTVHSGRRPGDEVDARIPEPFGSRS